MGTILKLINAAKPITTRLSRFNILFSNLYLEPQISSSISIISSAKLSTTPVKCDLMEFFDDKKNWGENEIKVGRAWTKDELRIKSNTDLHKLWYILLKERNMLMSMEHECNDKMELFPSPERIDKVKLSMGNLETVVRERNRAYYELETGETGERRGYVKPNELAYNYFYREQEHLIPKELNVKWRLAHKKPHAYALKSFVPLYREKLWNEKRKARNRERNQVMHILRRFPNTDRSVLATQYPSVDIDKLVQKGLCRGHYVPE